MYNLTTRKENRPFSNALAALVSSVYRIQATVTGRYPNFAEIKWLKLDFSGPRFSYGSFSAAISLGKPLLYLQTMCLKDREVDNMVFLKLFPLSG